VCGESREWFLWPYLVRQEPQCGIFACIRLNRCRFIATEPVASWAPYVRRSEIIPPHPLSRHKKTPHSTPIGTPAPRRRRNRSPLRRTPSPAPTSCPNPCAASGPRPNSSTAPVEDGFYYDIDLDDRIRPADFERIEAEMARIAQADRPFVRVEMTRDEAFANLPA
jgi:hypothetical protein